MKDVSLRNYFAAAMLTGVSSSIENAGSVSKEEREKVFKQVSEIIFEMADAMCAVGELTQ